MDDRWRFLYYAWPELWGRMQGVCAGGEVPGTSAGGVQQANPLHVPGGAMWTETRVGKHMSCVPRKAAIVPCIPVPQTDTGGWGEDPKAGGRSIVKELGKMAP